ncbi:MAG TPA: site-specific DNA-methyltransferase [Polyangiaceae bacterium]
MSESSNILVPPRLAEGRGIACRSSGPGFVQTSLELLVQERHSRRSEFAVVRADAVEWALSLAPESVDLVVTDPAYESLEKHRAIGTTTRLKHSKSSSNDWFDIFPNARFPELFAALYRVLRKNTHLYLFCDAQTLFVAKPAAEAAGFRFWKPLVWDKQRIGMGYHYRSRYEFILFFEKGKRRLNDLGIADVIECPRVLKGYPAEKPVAVSETLIRQSSEAGDLVIDPFCGSGSAGVAATRLGRTFRGSDICAEAVAIANDRVAGTAPGAALEPEERA